MTNLENKWALVTGASRGVGLRVASALVEKGVKVILHSRNLDNTRALLETLLAKGSDVHAIAAELGSQGGIDSLVSEVCDLTDNHLDILYSNAAIMTTDQPVFEPTVDEYLQSFMVNTIVPAKLCDAFIPGMLARN